MNMYKVGDRVKRNQTYPTQTVLAGTVGTVTEIRDTTGAVAVKWETGVTLTYGDLNDLSPVSPVGVKRTLTLRSGNVHLLIDDKDQETFDVRSPGYVEATFGVEYLDDIIAVLTALKAEL